MRGDYNRVCELCLFAENILNLYLRVKVSPGMKVHGHFTWIWDSHIGSALLLPSGKKNQQNLLTCKIFNVVES